jgi:hypothetical protein
MFGSPAGFGGGIGSGLGTGGSGLARIARGFWMRGDSG